MKRLTLELSALTTAALAGCALAETLYRLILPWAQFLPD